MAQPAAQFVRQTPAGVPFAAVERATRQRGVVHPAGLGTKYNDEGMPYGGVQYDTPKEMLMASDGGPAARHRYRGWELTNMINMTQSAVTAGAFFLFVAAAFDMGGKPIGLMSEVDAWFWFITALAVANFLCVGGAIMWLDERKTDHHPSHYTPFLSQFFYSFGLFGTYAALLGMFKDRFAGSIDAFDARYDSDVQLATVSQSLNVMMTTWGQLMSSLLIGLLVMFKFWHDSYSQHKMQIFATRMINDESVGRPAVGSRIAGGSQRGAGYRP